MCVTTKIHGVVLLLLYVQMVFTTIIIPRRTAPLSISYVSLPITRRSTTFLRAPYKNKLARLSVSSREYKASVYIYIPAKIDSIALNPTTSRAQRNFEPLLLADYSTPKIQHRKTITRCTYTSLNYFLLKQYVT